MLKNKNKSLKIKISKLVMQTRRNKRKKILIKAKIVKHSLQEV